MLRGLSAEEVAGRLEAELGEETTGDSDSGEEAGAGPGLPAVGVHSDGRAVILDEPYDDAPVLHDARLLARPAAPPGSCCFSSASANCGFFQVGCWVHGAMAWQITHCREEPETEEYQILGVPPGIFAGQGGTVSSPAGPSGCRRGHPPSGSAGGGDGSLTGIHYDRDGWWWDLRYRDLRPIDRASG